MAERRHILPFPVDSEYPFTNTKIRAHHKKKLWSFTDTAGWPHVLSIVCCKNKPG